MTMIETLDWSAIADQLDSEGQAVLPGLLATATSLAQDMGRLRRVSLASSDLGRGDLYY